MKYVPHAVPDDYALVFYPHRRVRVPHGTNPWAYEQVELLGIKPPGIDRREFCWGVEVRVHDYPSTH